jgi:hypothetical protein
MEFATSRITSERTLGCPVGKQVLAAANDQ